MNKVDARNVGQKGEKPLRAKTTFGGKKTNERRRVSVMGRGIPVKGGGGAGRSKHGKTQRSREVSKVWSQGGQGETEKTGIRDRRREGAKRFVHDENLGKGKGARPSAKKGVNRGKENKGGTGQRSKRELGGESPEEGGGKNAFNSEMRKGPSASRQRMGDSGRARGQGPKKSTQPRSQDRWEGTAGYQGGKWEGEFIFISSVDKGEFTIWRGKAPERQEQQGVESILRKAEFQKV